MLENVNHVNLVVCHFMCNVYCSSEIRDKLDRKVQMADHKAFVSYTPKIGRLLMVGASEAHKQIGTGTAN